MAPPQADHLLAPQVLTISFEMQPAAAALESLILLTDTHRLSGLGEWVYATYAAMSPEMQHRNDVVISGFDMIYHAVVQPFGERVSSFPQYIDLIAAQNAEDMRDKFLDAYVQVPHKYPEEAGKLKRIPMPGELLASYEVFRDYVVAIWPESAVCLDIYEDAYPYLREPAKMKALIVSHLCEMWSTYLEQEWQRVRPLLEECVVAYSQMDYTGFSGVEAIRAVTGRDVSGKWDHKLAGTSELAFVPNAHIGPYLSAMKEGETLYMHFGARQPRGVRRESSALSRSELLIRLNALSDDARLRILELLTQHDELCAQDIIEELNLSQSTVSRHLSQLTATGYLTERRREVQKCYSLNTDRVVDTLRALTDFLARK